MHTLPCRTAIASALRGYSIAGILACCLGATANVATAQWQTIPFPQTDIHGQVLDLTTISLSTPDVLYIGGGAANNGVVVATHDGGKSWGYIDAGPLVPSRIILGQNGTGYLCGRRTDAEVGFIGKILDGEEDKWEFWYTAPPVYVADIATPAPNTIVAVGDSGYVIASSDAGKNWAILSTGRSESVQRIVFPDAATGYALAGTPGTVVQPNLVMKCGAGGTGWSLLHEFPETTVLHGLAFINPEIGVVVGKDATGAVILRTTNGGVNWEQVHHNKWGQLTDVLFVNQTEGYAVGTDGLIFRTVNAGATWTAEEAGSTNDLSAISSAGSTLWVVGENGTVLRRALPSAAPFADRTTPSLSIAPHPVESVSKIQLGVAMPEGAQLTLMDMLGRAVAQFPVDAEGNAFIDRSGLPAGVYQFVAGAGERSRTGTVVMR
ncbi:MAG: hypothetical protein K1X90_07565 [Candidatus Kapabacteria bacterium]|nr:MAG: Serine/threonine protein kinase [Chlorobi bacterium OLB7]MBX7216819.1 hypothetical protein [Candidatus Kapabacteria bacterium]